MRMLAIRANRHAQAESFFTSTGCPPSYDFSISPLLGFAAPKRRPWLFKIPELASLSHVVGTPVEHIGIERGLGGSGGSTRIWKRTLCAGHKRPSSDAARLKACRTRHRP